MYSVKSSQIILAGLAGHSMALAGARANVSCSSLPSTWPTWSSFPSQSTLPDPFLPPNAFLSADIARVGSVEEWYECQQPQLLTMLQEYQYGYYPNHAEEAVSATRSGNQISITVTAGGKTGTFSAALSLPTGDGPFPVVINIGGMNTQPYLQQGIAIAEFPYLDVAPDNNSKTGAFWSLYNGRDIGIVFKCRLDILASDTP